MTRPYTVSATVHFDLQGKGARRTLQEGTAPPKLAGRLPRISRLMALAIHFDELITQGEISDYAELARLGQVSRARVTQIMNLLLLAPDLQEAILFLPRIVSGRDPIPLRRLQPVCLTPNWQTQRTLWQEILFENSNV